MLGKPTDGRGFSTRFHYTLGMAEKRLHEVSRAWREQYEKGKLAFERNNLDYALKLLGKVLEQEPGFYACREALRAAQFKKAGQGGGGGLSAGYSVPAT